MPNQARDHEALRHLVCGVCGLKKNGKRMYTQINELILHQIKSIQNEDYNVNDERYPLVVCRPCQNTLREHVKPLKYVTPLPAIPPFTDVSPQQPKTRENPTGWGSDHTCYMCNLNTSGRPSKRKFEETGQTAHVVDMCETTGHAKCPCPTCLQPHTGRGIPHPCKKTVANLKLTVKNFPSQVQDKLLHGLLKDKVGESGSNTIKLSTGGHTATVCLNPKPMEEPFTLSTNTLDEIKKQANLSKNQMQLITGGIRADAGRKSVPNRYSSHMSEEISTLSELYKSERIPLVTETKSGEVVTVTPTWVIYAPIMSLLEVVLKRRGIEDLNTVLLKVMCDTGRDFFKLCFCIIPFVDDIHSPVKMGQKATYAQGGVLARGGKESGVNKCIMVLCAPDIKEHYDNLATLFHKIQFASLFDKFPRDCIEFTGDLKLVAEVYGIMSAAGRHNCLYCDSVKGELTAGAPRTIGTLNHQYREWKSNGSIKAKCKLYANVHHPPLFQTLPDSTEILSITPPPELHILLGIFNHIWKAIESISSEHATEIYDFALRNDCIREDMFGKIYEGNECAKLLKNIDNPDKHFPHDLDGIKPHAHALRKLNNLRHCVFGSNLQVGWNDSISEFVEAYRAIPMISVTLKMHIVSAHLKDFLDKYGKEKGLGFFSEQTGESIHQKFVSTYRKYQLKNTKSDNFGGRLLRAVVEFSSLNV